jgi:hypothetical protein
MWWMGMVKTVAEKGPTGKAIGGKRTAGKRTAGKRTTGKRTSTNSEKKSAVCFKEGTYILTRGGYRKVDELNTGDRIKTVKNGYLPIYKIGRGRICHEKVSHRPKDCLYRYSQENYPELIEDLVLTGGHSILVDAFDSKEEEEENRKVFGGDVSKIDDHRRLLSCVNTKCVVYEQSGTYFIYHIAVENADEEGSYGIYANGLLVETCPINYIDRM